ncbi:MAG: hypothetical protein COB53_08910 [Elusimicrobia bacterium]|nr:MAG: hypothetical protein COB53_08910 [Elusimicrobiota bacterium]
MTKEELIQWGDFAREEVLIMRDSFRERGAKFFQRPLGLGALIVFTVYWFVYVPPVQKMMQLEEELNAARAASQFADDYKSLKARLENLFTKLPRVKDPENWLLQEVRRTLRAEGIVPLATTSPREQINGGYRFISMEVRCQATYSQIASWIARLEGGKNLLFIKELLLRKDDDPIGSNTATVIITTVVPSGDG